jgi:hypothetical protein
MFAPGARKEKRPHIQPLQCRLWRNLCRIVGATVERYRKARLLRGANCYLFYRVQKWLVLRRSAENIVVMLRSDGRLWNCLGGADVVVSGEGGERGANEESTVKDHGAGVSLSELAQSLW